MVARSQLLAVLFVVCAACQPKEVSFKLKVVTAACEGPSPLEGVEVLQLRITGPGLDSPLIAESSTDSGFLEIPEIPVGVNRVAEVRAIGQRQVLSWGKSQPFEVPDSVPEAAIAEIPIFLRRVNSFTTPSSVDDPATCQRLTTARAGHTATLLPDGRVLIAGGYQASTSGSIAKALSETEIFDPVKGTLVSTTALSRPTTGGSQRLPRAFHSATLLNNGQVLITGGRDTLDAAGSTYAVQSGLVFDPPTQSYLGYFNLAASRSHHAAVKDRSGRVLILGGWADEAGQIVDALEFYDPDSGRSYPVTGSVKRVEMAAASAGYGDYVAIAGGTDGSLLKDDVLFFSYDQAAHTFKQGSSTLTLKERRRGPAAAPVGAGDRLLLLGGYATNEPSDLRSLATSEVVSTGLSFLRKDGPTLTPRGDLCAATLSDGRVLLVGGRVAEGQKALSVGTAELVSPAEDGTLSLKMLPSLPMPGHYLTCTALKDGTVLVTGGVRSGAVGTDTLRSVYLFTPAPLD